jgi:thiamine biosynthesis lipoprotein
VLAESLELSRQSDGAFDVSVGPYVQLWRKARRTEQLPTEAALAAARRSVGYQAIRFNPRERTVALLRPGMRLDFGGIAKGYAADAARDVLRAKGLTRTLVALAGDISAGDPPPGESGWRIGIQGIGTGDRPLEAFIWLKNEAVSTAGDAYQFVEIGGRRYSHLVDPKTGLGITRRVSVTVIAPRGTTSDGLDTAAAILGPEQGFKLLENRGVAARFSTLEPAGLRIQQTTLFKQRLLAH